MKNLLQYFKVSLRVELHELASFRTNLFTEIAMIVIRVYMMWALWTALYIGKAEVNGINYNTILLYSALSVIFEFLLQSKIEKSITNKVQTGDIAMMIARPISYPISLLFEQLALTVGNIFLRVIPYTLILILSGLVRNVTVDINGWFVLSVFLSYLLSFFYQLSFGFLAFWTMELDGFSNARTALMRFFSGSLIPLWFFPKGLTKVAKFLPFQAIYSTPLSICIGKLYGNSLLCAISNQLIWIIIFIGISILTWNHARRRIVVNGG